LILMTHLPVLEIHVILALLDKLYIIMIKYVLSSC